MIEINGKVYRNIQEQVQENMDDIEALDTRVTTLENEPVIDAYTKAESDAKFQTKSGMSTYVTNHDFELTIDALATGVEQELSDKLDKYKHFDDDDNPEDYNIKQPQTYGSGIQLTAARDDNHHPDYSDLIVKPTQIIMTASSANHGDDDVDYTGSIELTDGYVDIEATDGEDITTLRVSPTEVTVNGSPISKQLYAHSIDITYSTTSSNDKVGGVAYFISNDSTAITKDNIITKLVAAGYDDSKKIIFSGHAYSTGASQSCSLTGLAKKSNSATSLSAYIYYANSGKTTFGSITIDTSDTNITLDITDTVITL